MSWQIEKILTDGLPGGVATATVKNIENDQTEKVIVNTRSNYDDMVNQVGVEISKGNFKK